jgi:hypothetical protein
MWSVTFSCLASSSSSAILSQAGLLEVHVTYMWSHGYFLTQGPVLLDDCSSEKQMLMRGSECAACLA